MPRFDIYANPNQAASHAFYVDVQSNFVMTRTRWCIPLLRRMPAKPLLQGAHGLVDVNNVDFVLDTPNLLAVPASLLRQQCGQLKLAEQAIAESCIEFMLRGY
jgi:hypothetical protein